MAYCKPSPAIFFLPFCHAGFHSQFSMCTPAGDLYFCSGLSFQLAMCFTPNFLMGGHSVVPRSPLVIMGTRPLASFFASSRSLHLVLRSDHFPTPSAATSIEFGRPFQSSMFSRSSSPFPSECPRLCAHWRILFRNEERLFSSGELRLCDYRRNRKLHRKAHPPRRSQPTVLSPLHARALLMSDSPGLKLPPFL